MNSFLYDLMYFVTWFTLSTVNAVYFNCCFISTNTKEGNVLFNDALNTFYLWLYDIELMVKDHSDSKTGNLLPPLHWLLFPVYQQVFFYMHHPTDRIEHTMAFGTPVMEHLLEWEIAQWISTNRCSILINNNATV